MTKTLAVVELVFGGADLGIAVVSHNDVLFIVGAILVTLGIFRVSRLESK